jgi:UMP-CMP kinase
MERELHATVVPSQLVVFCILLMFSISYSLKARYSASTHSLKSCLRTCTSWTPPTPPTLPRVFFVLGAPGAGKGTQCEMLANEFGMIHLSAGELLRVERASKSLNSVLIEQCITEGKIVPAQITIDLLKATMISSKSSHFLVDGFPRNWDNILGWESTMQNICCVVGVIFIDCPQLVLEERILVRGLSSGRSDDNLSILRKRFKTYYDSTLPIIDHFQESGKLIRLNGNQNREAVFSQFKAFILPILESNLSDHLRSLYICVRTHKWLLYSDSCDPELVTILNDKVMV